jgi:hypothetical protein
MLQFTLSSHSRRADVYQIFLLFFWTLSVSCSIAIRNEHGVANEGSRVSKYEEPTIDDYNGVWCQDMIYSKPTASYLNTRPNGRFENDLYPQSYHNSLTKFCASDIHGGHPWTNMAAYCDTSRSSFLGRGKIGFSTIRGDARLQSNFPNKLICIMYCHCDGLEDPKAPEDADLLAYESLSEAALKDSENDVYSSKSSSYSTFLHWVASADLDGGSGSNSGQQTGPKTYHRPRYIAAPRTCQVKRRCESFSCSGPDRESCSCNPRVVGGTRQRETCAGKMVDPRLFMSTIQSSVGG